LEPLLEKIALTKFEDAFSKLQNGLAEDLIYPNGLQK